MSDFIHPRGHSALGEEVEASNPRRMRAVWVAAVGGCLLAATLVACTTLFDETPTALPPQRAVRRDLLREIGDLKQELSASQLKATARVVVGTASEAPPPPIEKAKSWEEAVKLLPKDRAGRIDWVQALEKAAIAPRSGVDPKAAPRLELDMEVDLTSTASKVFGVTFGHESHTQWLRCKNCHQRFFPLKRGAPPTLVTMPTIAAGRHCGACHGTVAFGIRGECDRCHDKVPAKTQWSPKEEPRTPLEKAKTWDEAAKLLPVKEEGPDWAKALSDGMYAPRAGIRPDAEEEEPFPSDVDLATGDDSPGKVVFSHEFHTTLLTCVTCHREMDKEATKTVFVGQHEDCKVCHGRVSFSMKKCDRCHSESE